MVQMLDTHWPTKLARERIAAKLQQSESSRPISIRWARGAIIRRPGVAVDLSQPQPAPAPAKSDDDDDEDEPSTASAAPVELARGCQIRARCWPCSACPTATAALPGSNNWVVAGKHTASGKPLLSNDMHLSLTVPNIWYMADLQRAGLSRGGRHAAGHAVCDCRTQRARGLGLHRADGRRAGSLHREARRQGQLSRTSTAAGSRSPWITK